MKKTLLVLTALLLVFGAVACKPAAEEAAPAPQAEAAPEPAEAPAEDAPADGVVTVAGTLGCGHCTYSITGSCAPAVQTEDGTTYAIEAGEGQEQLMAVRLDGLPITVTGTVADVEGVATLTAESFELGDAAAEEGEAPAEEDAEAAS